MKTSYVLLNILGLSILMTAALLMLWVFLDIALYGRFGGYENNLLILYSEVVLAILGVLYAGYIWAVFIWKC
jgi:hypothetical protein